MNRLRKISRLQRGQYLNAALLLLFFAILSPPHRVHHVLDQLSPRHEALLALAHSHDHGQSHDHSRPALPANPTDCAVLSAAQSANGLAATPLGLPTAAWTVDLSLNPSLPIVSSFNPSPRAQRAPPLL
ncbi:MAG: hypothetical protein FJ143_17125 [Deltaproteobacteria bacterium]|nr:hypothetical protein [Deltaproteobacteria bacterium]